MSHADSDDGMPSTSGRTQPSGSGGDDDPCDPMSLPALFWDEMPENVEEHPDYMGLQAIADECTPEERAEGFKVLSAWILQRCMHIHIFTSSW